MRQPRGLWFEPGMGRDPPLGRRGCEFGRVGGGHLIGRRRVAERRIPKRFFQDKGLLNDPPPPHPPTGGRGRADPEGAGWAQSATGRPPPLFMESGGVQFRYHIERKNGALGAGKKIA